MSDRNYLLALSIPLVIEFLSPLLVFLLTGVEITSDQFTWVTIACIVSVLITGLIDTISGSRFGRRKKRLSRWLSTRGV